MADQQTPPEPEAEAATPHRGGAQVPAPGGPAGTPIGADEPPAPDYVKSGYAQALTLRSLSAPGAAGVDMLRTACLVILAGIALIWAMVTFAVVLVPFVLAVLLALMLSPLIDALVRRMRFPRPLAVGAVFLLAAGMLAGGITALVPTAAAAVQQVREWTRADRIDDTIAYIQARIPFDVPAELSQRVQEEAPGMAARLAYGLGGGALGVLAQGVLVGVFVLFLLLGRTDTPVPPDSLRGQVERRIQSYLAVMLLVSALTGLLVGITLELLGVPLGWLFGVLAFVLNFIPNIGSIVATALPLPVVLLDDTMSPMAKVLAFAIPGAIQFVMGNLVAPKLLGDTLELSPVAVLMGLIFFGTIWGLPGMVLSTPVLAVTKIVFSRVPTLSPLAAALAGRLEFATGEEEP